MRRIVGVVVAVAAALCWAVPATSGGYVAKVAATATAARSSSTFTCAASAVAKPTLFAYPLTDPAGSTAAADSVGPASRNGTYNAGITVAAATVCPRDGGTAWRLDGTGSQLTSPQVTIGSGSSLEIWFRTTRAPELLAGVKVVTTSTANYVFCLDANGKIVVGGAGAAGPLMQGTNAPAADDRWHHLVFAGGGSSTLLYLDGVTASPALTGALPSGSATTWTFGWGDTAQSTTAMKSYPRFAGDMRSVALVSSVLTATEVADRYAAGRP